MSFKSFFSKLSLLFISIFLFAVSTSFTSWIVYLPVLFLVHYVDLKFSWLWGGIYGFLSYFFYAFWLVAFNIPASIGVFVFYFILLAILFFLLKLCDLIFCEKSYIFQWILICAFEYLKTVGFLGFSYGVTAYSQWKNIPLIQCCDIFGVFGLNSLIIFFSAFMYKSILCFINNSSSKKISVLLKNIFLDKGFYIFIFFIVAAYIYGFVRLNQNPTIQKMNVVAVQNNSDPWKIGFNTYKEELDCLINLTNDALLKYPDTDIVVWPETAVIPSIYKHFYYPTDKKRTNLIQEMLEFVNSKKCGFVIGNYHVEQNETEVNDFNSAFFFIPNQNVLPPTAKIYSKIHLVPFTEYFPYDKYFPHIYKLLLAGDTHLWTPGKEYSVFEYGNLLFSTPICFEDTFGSDCRMFVKKGAKAFINLSNDAWSNSLRCQTQHLSMAVFRSVENKVPSVRSSASGHTCIIDRFGQITNISKPFEKNYVYGQIEFDNLPMTFYSKYGDVIGNVVVLLGIITICFILVLAFRRNFNH